MQLERKKVTTAVVVALSLLFAHLPNTSAPAATYCIGPAAYPPDLPDCLDPVVEAQKEAKRVADEQKAAADAAALKAQQDKEEQGHDKRLKALVLLFSDHWLRNLITYKGEERLEERLDTRRCFTFIGLISFGNGSPDEDQ